MIPLQRQSTWPPGLAPAIEAPALMLAMIERLGIDTAIIRFRSGTEMAEASRRCATCPHVALCANWQTAAQPTDACPRFCPNAAFFDTLPRLIPDCPDTVRSI